MGKLDGNNWFYRLSSVKFPPWFKRLPLVEYHSGQMVAHDVIRNVLPTSSIVGKCRCTFHRLSMCILCWDVRHTLQGTVKGVFGRLDRL